MNDTLLERIWINRLAIPTSPKLAGTYYLKDDEAHDMIEFVRAEAAEVERDAALKALDENWITHQQVITSRGDGFRAGLEAAAKVAEGFDLSIMSTTLADLRARQIAEAIRSATHDNHKETE